MTNEHTGALPPPARNPGPPPAAPPTSATQVEQQGGRVQRWAMGPYPHSRDICMLRDPEGRYVLFTDHERAVAEVKAASTMCAPARDVQGSALPPLPEAFEAEFTAPGMSPVSVYTAEQMQDYARAALAATGNQQVGEVSEGNFRAMASRQTASAESNATAEALISHARAKIGEVQGDALVTDEMVQTFKAALSRAQLPGKTRTYFLKDSELPSLLREVLAARQPGAQVPVVEFQCRLMDVKTDLPTENWHHSPTYEENPGRGTHYWVQYRKRYIYYTQPAQGIDLGAGIQSIAAERERQLHAEGFSRDGDQQYRRGELAKAATAYVQLAAMDLEAGTRDHIAWHGPAAVWPWAREWWKPVDARRDLVRAGALIAAQIDLIDAQRDAAPGVGNG